MSTVNNTDLFLVERDGQLHNITSDDMSTLNDTDLLLVEREGTQYKLEAKDLTLGPTGSLEAPVEVLTPLNGSGVGALQPYNPISSPIVTVEAGGTTALETSEITDITIASPARFSTTLYTGTGNSPRSIPTGVDNTDKALIWVKNRNATERHCLHDTVRGLTSVLASDEYSSQRTRAFMRSFDSNGFTVQTNDTEINSTNEDYIAWNFRAAPGFFDIVTYQGVSGPTEIPHSLNSVPGVIIVKNVKT